MTIIGMILLLLGGTIYTIIPILNFKLASVVLIIVGYFIVKHSDKLNITLGGIHGRTKLRKPQ